MVNVRITFELRLDVIQCRETLQDKILEYLLIKLTSVLAWDWNQCVLLQHRGYSISVGSIISSDPAPYNTT